MNSNRALLHILYILSLTHVLLVFEQRTTGEENIVSDETKNAERINSAGGDGIN